MKLQFASDIHLEHHHHKPREDDYFNRFVTPCGADLLILAGDIGYPEAPITKQFMTWVCKNWGHVIWIFGNHEYYNKDPSFVWKKPHKKALSMTEKETMAENYMMELPNLYVMFNATLELPDFPGYIFIGSTLWTTLKDTQFSLIQHDLADFTYIQQDNREVFNPLLWARLHQENADFIQRELDSAHTRGKKAVVITHHLPTYRMILPLYYDSPMNCGFAAQCDSLLEHPATATWICGHSHGQLDLPIQKPDGTRIFCRLNAYGYPKEFSAITYSPMKCMSLS